MSLKFQVQTNQPLLLPAEVNECIRLGNAWSGNGLPWPMREIRLGHSGNLSSLRQGSGIDFSETRPYQAGDNPRHMNWRATARTGRQQVRVFQQDLTPVTYFLIDRRSYMRFGTRQRLKVTQAARLAIFLAAWEELRGAELGSLILNETLQWQAPVSGHDGIYQLAHLATKPAPPMPHNAKTNMKLALTMFAENIPAGSHLYLLSDFYDVDDSLLPQLYQLGEQHKVWALNIHDVAEQQLPKAGNLQLVWNEITSTQGSLVYSDDAAVQIKHRKAFEEQQLKVKTLCDSAGIFYTSISNVENNIANALQSNSSKNS